MVSSEMLRRVALVRTDVSEELSAPFRVTRIGEPGTLAVTSNRVFLRSVRLLLVTANVPGSPFPVTLMKEALSSFETSVLTRATRRNIPEDTLLHSQTVALTQGLYLRTAWSPKRLIEENSRILLNRSARLFLHVIL
jgi:hypothetical protein